MHTLKIALTIFIALLLQMVLPKYLPFFKFIDLPLLVTVFLSLQREPFQGMLTGLAAGLGGDIIAGGILGVGGFSKTLIGYLVAMASIKFPLENPLARLAVVAVASATNTLLYVGLHFMLEQDLPRTSTWAEFGRTLGWKALGDTVTAIFVFIVLNRVFQEQEATRRMAIRKRFYE
ncbi:MAG TPA: rod shape-determining protein MreD [Blastocatellia bacterium]|nr:rod shape-determining protein MreD [Blastocatellia bacterium]